MSKGKQKEGTCQIGLILANKEERLRLPVRSAPYWEVVLPKVQLGYRRGLRGGTWLGKIEDESGHRDHFRLGTADDNLPVSITKPGRQPEEGESRIVKEVLDYKRAKMKLFDECNKIVNKKDDNSTGKEKIFKISQILNEYLECKTPKNIYSKNFRETKRRIGVLDYLFGNLDLNDLSAQLITKWLNAFLVIPPGKKGESNLEAFKNYLFSEEPVQFQGSSQDECILNARKSSANRILADFKAALNCFVKIQSGKNIMIPDYAWRYVKPFGNAGNIRDYVLTREEQISVVNNCQDDIRPLVLVALLTGARYGELVNAKVSDFKEDTAILRVNGKTGPREVPLFSEAYTAMAYISDNRSGEEYLFLKKNGKKWNTSEQQRFNGWVKTHLLNDFVTFYTLRHTCITNWARAGVNLSDIADIVGNSVSIIEKHYKKYSPDSVIDSTNNRVPVLGTNLALIEGTKSRKRNKESKVSLEKLEFDFDFERLNPNKYVSIFESQQIVKTKKPNKNELEEMVWEFPTSDLARMYGVSDTLISKWCKSFGIKKPGRGYWQRLKVVK